MSAFRSSTALIKRVTPGQWIRYSTTNDIDTKALYYEYYEGKKHFASTLEDKIFKDLLSDKRIRNSFLKTFTGLEVDDSVLLDGSMNSVLKCKDFYNFIHKSKLRLHTEQSQGSEITVNKNGERSSDLEYILKGFLDRSGFLTELADIHQKERIMDIKCSVPGRGYVNVEVQVVPKNDWDYRAVAYSASTFLMQTKPGNDWGAALPTISVNILSRGFSRSSVRKPYLHQTTNPWKKDDYFLRKYQLKDVKNEDSMRIISALEIIQVNLANIKKEEMKRLEPPLRDWLNLLRFSEDHDPAYVTENIKTPEVIEAYNKIKFVNLADELKYAAIDNHEKFKLTQEDLDDEREGGREEEREKIVKQLLNSGMCVGEIATALKLSKDDIEKLGLDSDE